MVVVWLGLTLVLLTLRAWETRLPRPAVVAASAALLAVLSGVAFALPSSFEGVVREVPAGLSPQP